MLASLRDYLDLVKLRSWEIVDHQLFTLLFVRPGYAAIVREATRVLTAHATRRPNGELRYPTRLTVRIAAQEHGREPDDWDADAATTLATQIARRAAAKNGGPEPAIRVEVFADPGMLNGFVVSRLARSEVANLVPMSGSSPTVTTSVITTGKSTRAPEDACGWTRRSSPQRGGDPDGDGSVTGGPGGRLVGSDGTIRQLPLDRGVVLGRVGSGPAWIVRDPAVSSEHVAITARTGGAFDVTDLHSTHGTAVDGAALHPGVTSTVQPGSLVRIGDTVFLLVGPPDGGARLDKADPTPVTAMPRYSYGDDGSRGPAAPAETIHSEPLDPAAELVSLWADFDEIGTPPHLASAADIDRAALEFSRQTATRCNDGQHLPRGQLLNALLVARQAKRRLNS